MPKCLEIGLFGRRRVCAQAAQKALLDKSGWSQAAQRLGLMASLRVWAQSRSRESQWLWDGEHKRELGIQMDHRGERRLCCVGGHKKWT